MEIWMSNSKLGTYELCPYMFRLTYIAKIKAKYHSNASSAFGSGIHNLLEWWYLQKKYDLKGLLDNYKKYLDEEFNKPDLEPCDASYKQMLYGKAPYMLRVFWQRQRKDGLLCAPIDTELKFEVSYTTPDGDVVILNGRIDLIIKGCDGVEIDDYKTGVHAMSQEDADKDFQLTIYSLAYRLLRRTNPEKYPELEGKVVLHYLAKDLKVESIRGKEHYKEFLAEVNRVVKLIKEEKFEPTPSRENCKWCAFKGTVYCNLGM